MLALWRRSNLILVCLLSLFILPVLPEPITSSTQRCLLYSTNESINFINLNHSGSTPSLKSTNQKHGIVTSSDLGEISQFDFILEDETFFWVDLLEEKIKKVRLSSKFSCKEDASIEHHNITDLFNISLMPYDGFACDWISRNLYWVDSEEGRIEVGSIDGRWRRTLVWSGLDQPRDLKLDPVGRYMYWIDVGVEPRIEKCGLDGSDRSTLLKRPFVGHPFSLILDLIGRMIYWLDQELNGVYYADFNGSNVKHLPSTINPSSLYSFAMVVGTDSIYFVDAKKNYLKSSGKFNLTFNQNVWRFSEAPKDIRLIENQIIVKDDIRMSLTPCQSSGCSHMCLSKPRPPFFTCACPSGVVLMPDNQTCNDGPSQMLLIARQTDIRRISLDTPDFTDTLLINEDQGMIVAIDYDPVDEMIYWTDVDLHVIKRSKINGDDVEVLLEEGIHTPEGIAIDWISRFMYWTDTGTDRIEVAVLNGNLRKIIIKDMLDEPRAIVVDPFEGNLFWSDWGVVKRIERSHLDGSNRTTIVDWSISWPNGLALDRPMRRLYWADAQFDLIESCNYDGSDRTKIVSGDLPHVFGLSLIGDHIYWTEWQSRVLERANKNTGQSRSVVIEELPNLMGLAAVNSKMSNKSLQSESKGCRLNNGNCSHFCFRFPSESYKCSCPEGFLLSEINRVSCDPMPAYIIFNNRSHLRKVMVSDDGSNSGDEDVIAGSKDRVGEDDDDDDDGEGSHGISDNFLTDDEEDKNGGGDDDGNIAVGQSTNGYKERNKIFLDYIFSEGVVLMYDLMLKRVLEFELESLELGNNDQYWNTKIQSSIMKSPSTFAVDWLSGNIYWTDWDKIEMSRRDGSSRLVIIWMNCRPRTIALDPLAGFLFWNNELNSFGTIERTLLDGSFRNIIIRNVGQITGMTVDPETQQLFWADHKLGQIEYSSYDGSKRKVLLSNIEPYRISFFENSLYWSDMNGRIILTNKIKGGQKVVAKGLIDQVDVKVLHPSLQKGSNFCSMSKDNGGCSNLCINLKKPGSRVTHKCACPTQYVLNKEDNNTCEAPHIAAYLAMSSRIISLSLEEMFESPDVILSIHPSNPIRSVEYDPINDYIYFIEGSTRISYAKSDRSQTTILLETAQEESPVARMVPFDMVLDHAHNILYWSDMTYGTIVMTQLTDHINHIVFNLTPGDNLRKPKYLALHSDKQILFWSNGHSIEAGRLTHMTSYDLTVSTVINGTKVGPICVDEPSNVLYWFNMDAHSIEMSRLNGEGRRVIVEGVRSAVGFGVSGSHLYWVDKEKQTFESCLKGSGKQRAIVRGRLPTGLKDVIVLNRKRIIKNKLRKKGEELPSTTSSDLIKCPVDHFSCLMVNHDYLLPHHRESYKKIDNGWNKEPPVSNFNDVGCIPMNWKCDGNMDCLGSYDEANCTTCREDALLCLKDKKCIGRTLICDGKLDCSDGSDENGCISCLESNDQYNGNTFNCYPGICYSIKHVCDGVVDCETGADEMDCIQADALEKKKGFNYWLTVASVVVCAALASVVVLIFLLKQKSTCYSCSQKYQKDGLITLTTTEHTSTNLGTLSSIPAQRLVSPQFSPAKHLSTSTSTLNVPTEHFVGPFPSLATSFADSGLTCTDISYHDSGGGGVKRKDLQNHDKSSSGEQGKTYGGRGWQYSDNDLYFPYDGRSNVDEIPALPPPPPTPCSQSQLLRSRQTSSTGSSNFGDHIAPSNSSMIQSTYHKNRQRPQLHPPPQFDCLVDPRLALPPSGRSSGVSRNQGNSGNSSGCEAKRFSPPISSSSKLR